MSHFELVGCDDYFENITASLSSHNLSIHKILHLFLSITISWKTPRVSFLHSNGYEVEQSYTCNSGPSFPTAIDESKCPMPIPLILYPYDHPFQILIFLFLLSLQVNQLKNINLFKVFKCNHFCFSYNIWSFVLVDFYLTPNFGFSLV